MKKILFLIGFVTMSFLSMAQSHEVNPSVQWKFVVSTGLNLTSGNFISYEFPAEKNYDYILTIQHNEQNIHAAIMIYDLQDQPIDKIVLPDNSLSADLQFSVPQSGTYKVVLGLTNPEGSKGQDLPSTFTIIRRPKV